jgi:hypothetical protein
MVLKRVPHQKRMIAVLGGVDGIAMLTEVRNRTSVWNWIASGRFPARYFLVMTTALAAHGYAAPAKWWDQRGQYQDHKYDAATQDDEQVVAA